MTSLEQRQRINELSNQGHKAPAIAEELGISVFTVRKWRTRLKKGDRIIPQWAVLRQAV